jgi:Secretion system C-terminal sorting domain
MKTLFLTFIILFLFSLSNAQIVEIADTAFLHALIQQRVDTNEDSLISYAEAEAVIFLDVSGSEENPGNISDMIGIEAFINLETLDCSYNQLSSLDISTNTSILARSGYYCSPGLAIREMPSLYEVCVWDEFIPNYFSDFEYEDLGDIPPNNVLVDTAGSSNVYFTNDCSSTTINDYNLYPVAIFPNPTRDILNIEAESVNYARLEIYAITGEMILNIQINSNSQTIDISNYTSGIYIIKIISDKDIYSRKILINK